MHMVAKMDKENGSRIGIVLNGSPLFNGDAGSGWSNIRKMLLDKNLLDCIVSLPTDLFYGTGISTYLWILDNKRPEEKHNKVLFIDAAHKNEYANSCRPTLARNASTSARMVPRRFSKFIGSIRVRRATSLMRTQERWNIYR